MDFKAVRHQPPIGRLHSRKPEGGSELLPRERAGGQSARVHDGKPKASGRHRMGVWLPTFMESDLQAQNSVQFAHGFARLPCGMAVAAVRPEEDDAVAVLAVVVRIVPEAIRVEPDHRLDPALSIQIRPLVREAEMALDNPAPDRL